MNSCNIVEDQNNMSRKIILLATILLAIAVVLGALGAHALKAKLSPEHLESFKTGVTYQFYHGFGLLLLGICMEVFKKPGLKYVAYLFGLGILFFSGSIYLLSTTEISGLNVLFLGPVTPLGGVLFIAGWTTAFIQFIKPRS